MNKKLIVLFNMWKNLSWFLKFNSFLWYRFYFLWIMVLVGIIQSNKLMHLLAFFPYTLLIFF